MVRSLPPHCQPSETEFLSMNQHRRLRRLRAPIKSQVQRPRTKRFKGFMGVLIGALRRLSRRGGDGRARGRRGARDCQRHGPRHDQRRHLVLPARVAARREVRKAAPAQDQVQDRPGRYRGRHRRRQSRQRHDRRRLIGTDFRRRGPRLLPDRQVRDLRGHQQSEHAEQPHAEAAVTSIFTGKTKQLERSGWRHARPGRSKCSAAHRSPAC